MAITDPLVEFVAAEDDRSWGYTERVSGGCPEPQYICDRCGCLIGKVGPHVDWHRALAKALTIAAGATLALTLDVVSGDRG